MIIGDCTSYDFLPDIRSKCSSYPGSLYKNISVTGYVDTIDNLEGKIYLNIVHPFDSLDIIRSKGPTEKCWVFGWVRPLKYRVRYT